MNQSFCSRLRQPFCLAFFLCALLAGCSPVRFVGGEGRILDTATQQYVDRETVILRAIASKYVIFGEIHDNGVHQRLQHDVFGAMLKAGRSPALALEQIDRKHQAALDAVRARGERDAERLADAGRIDRKGWRWPEYKPLVELAVANNLPLLAANFSREDARTLMRTGLPAPGLPVLTPDIQLALEQDIVLGHCGIRPSTPVLTGMIEAQRARDAQMAQTLTSAGRMGAVLVAGAGHGRRDRGVPSYLPTSERDQLLSIAFIEMDADAPSASRRNFEDVYDLVWFTPRAKREDPCKNFKLP